MKKCILAGNRREFETYLDENGLTDSEAFYGYSKDRMLGEVYDEVIAIGTHIYKPFSIDLYDFALKHTRNN